MEKLNRIISKIEKIITNSDNKIYVRNNKKKFAFVNGIEIWEK